jgi:Protein of unknown function (DUF1059)
LKKALICDCGFEARAEDEAELVVQVQRHAWEAHGMALSEKEALVFALRGELNERCDRRCAPSWPQGINTRR